MNDKSRLRFLDRLAESGVTVSDAAFIESLGDTDTLTEQQRSRVDAMHARHKERQVRKPRVLRDAPVVFQRDADLEAKFNPCRKGHRPVAGQNSTSGAQWQCWCACGGLSQPAAEPLVAQWNLIHPKDAK